MLQDLITAATNDAIKKAKEMMTQEMGPLGQMMKQAGLGGL
jgi:DNA-binding protein YbaB